ncbi:MAG TPA: hypothetical protein VFJ02_01220 [Vicinamibacterales bacterium]|nr:hypothetical protein [Vicinamibacterales bacterium]
MAMVAAAACRDVPPSSPPAAAPASPPSTVQSNASAPVPRLRIDGSRFVTPDGRPFRWRGITAFRLADYVADGQESEAVRLLDWAAAQELKVVRVLTMMGGQFDLRPDDGRRALPRVLELAAQRGLYVEVVALAGTADIPVNLEEHIDAVAAILARHTNGLLEIANEPVHPSQSADVQNPAVLKRLADRVPRDVPISLGSIERGDGFGAGTYLTWHAPRDSGREGWGHVLALADGADLLSRWKKPVISDEPIGAGAALQPGRRDNEPARFRAAAILTRLTGAGATFHYEGGLHARVPEGRELECFTAWNEAWTMMPGDVEELGTFRATGTQGSIVRGLDREHVIGAYERGDARRAFVLVLANPVPSIAPAEGWTIVATRQFDHGALLTAAKRE